MMMTAFRSSNRLGFAPLRFSAWALVFATLVRPAVAADPDVPSAESQDRTLEDLIQQGIKLRKAGNDEAALQVFHEAERRSPDSVRVLLNIAGAAAAVGKWIECDAYFRKVSAHRDDPYYQRHRAAITAIESTLAKKVGRFIASGTPAGAEVRLNGELIGNLNIAEPQAVEAGTYVLEVSQPGYYRVRRSITIQPGMLARETIELNEMPATATPSASSPASPIGGSDPSESQTAPAGRAAPAEFPAREQSVRPDSGRWFTWTLVGLGAAAAATSGVAFWFREQHAKDWNNDARCQNSRGSTREELCGEDRVASERAERVSVIAGGAALVLGTGALVHWLTTRSSDTNSATLRSTQADSGRGKTSTSLLCGVGPLSVACQGSF